MTDAQDWSIRGLLADLAGRRAHPAVITCSAGQTDVVSCAVLAERAMAVGRGLHARGIGHSDPVAVRGANSAAWIIAALGVLAAGATLVPIDDLADADQVAAALDSSGARMLMTTAAHAAADAMTCTARGLEVIRLDTANPSWDALLATAGADPPPPSPGDPATLFWTSGTTGSPKAFLLSHRNIASNVAALREMGVVDVSDRALLPLPLHHAYPFIVGMLSTLACGTAVVLPAGSTGPQILQAVRDSAVTTIIGVPRLYDALVGAIEGRVASRGLLMQWCWQGLVKCSAAIQRMTGLRPGVVLFWPVRRAIGPQLRYLISGGARLDEATATGLEVLGWTVLSGYGLAETASLFTGSTVADRRAGTAGRPIGDGRIRIAHPDERGIGEIELYGSNITAGYLNNPTANAETYTTDGWFRTGDLGFLDRDGYLTVTGRIKEVLVLGGGKKVIPEDLERVYAAIPQVREIALLEENGALVALVRPDPAALRAMGATNVRDGIRVVLSVRGQDLPSHERLAGFALTDQPFPRTRLGKPRRFLLHQMYEQARSGAVARAPRAISREDEALLSEPIAAAVWALLIQRWPGQITDPDVNLALDLNLDSFGWMELAVELEARVGVHLSQPDIAGIETVRDLLHLAPQRCAGAESSTASPSLAQDTAHWLAPTGRLLTACGVVLYCLNWVVKRSAFRLRVIGVDKVPRSGSFVITPNHVSDLDGMAIAAALPLSRLRRVYWAGDIVRLFYNRASRLFCRAVHLFPVDERYPTAALDTATQVLQAGNSQVWFPEGWRAPDGALQRFLPGIGQLLLRTNAAAIPAWIEGAFEALPRGRRIPRFRRVTLIFGPAVSAAELLREGEGRSDDERIADALHRRVAALAVHHREGNLRS
ncbi:MAG: AMP-binding protein [Acetobacteraceae bacterium]